MVRPNRPPGRATRRASKERRARCSTAAYGWLEAAWPDREWAAGEASALADAPRRRRCSMPTGCTRSAMPIATLRRIALGCSPGLRSGAPLTIHDPTAACFRAARPTAIEAHPHETEREGGARAPQLCGLHDWIDRADIEAILHKDFTFTSPYDDHIGWDDYFARCWANAGTFERIDIQAVNATGDGCFVLYDGLIEARRNFSQRGIFLLRGRVDPLGRGVLRTCAGWGCRRCRKRADINLKGAQR